MILISKIPIIIEFVIEGLDSFSKLLLENGPFQGRFLVPGVIKSIHFARQIPFGLSTFFELPQEHSVSRTICFLSNSSIDIHFCY